MKCIETGCSSFYVDKVTGECMLGTLKEPFLAYSQPQSDSITVYRNKDLGDIKPLGMYEQGIPKFLWPQVGQAKPSG